VFSEIFRRKNKNSDFCRQKYFPANEKEFCSKQTKEVFGKDK
jgi:hypothetical protein